MEKMQNCIYADACGEFHNCQTCTAYENKYYKTGNAKKLAEFNQNKVTIDLKQVFNHVMDSEGFGVVDKKIMTDAIMRALEALYGIETKINNLI